MMMMNKTGSSSPTAEAKSVKGVKLHQPQKKDGAKDKLVSGGMFHLLTSNAKTKANNYYYNNKICLD